MKVKFKKWNCEVIPTHYRQNNRKAIQLVENNQLVATATVNLPNEKCKDNQVFIKDYSENEGMLEALIDHKIVMSGVIKSVKTGFVNVPLAELTPKALKLWDNVNP